MGAPGELSKLLERVKRVFAMFCEVNDMVDFSNRIAVQPQFRKDGTGRAEMILLSPGRVQAGHVLLTVPDLTLSFTCTPAVSDRNEGVWLFV